MIAIMRRLIQSLDDAQVRYCHFKSNFHLQAALNGGTDFDVLVRPGDGEAFRLILAGLDIRRVVSPPDKAYPLVEDYIGFDHDTGRLVHIHAHFRLVVGEMYVKNHVLPLEDLVFANLTRQENTPVPAPELELFLLCIRAVLKTNYSLLDRLLNRTVRPNAVFPDAIHEEFRFLFDQSDEAKLRAIIADSGLDFSLEEILDLVRKSLDNSLTIGMLRALKRSYLNRLEAFRRDRSIYWRQKWCALCRRRWMARFSGYRRKIFQDRGLFVAFVGADGAGKSTLVDDICKWLSWKVEFKRFYFGIPQGFPYRTALNAGQRMQRMRMLRGLGDRLYALAWLALARRRRKLFHQAAALGASGGVAVADRFPLREFRSMPQPMDGPRISKEIPGLPRIMGQYEEYVYDCLGRPDLLVVLAADFEVLRSRKTDIGMRNQQIKAEAVNALPEDRRFKRIDASQPYDQVLLQAKRLLWEALDANR